MSSSSHDEPFRTRGPAIDPAKRRSKHRRAVRVLVHTSDEVLLFRDSDPGLPGSTWWMTPGGGIDAGEDDTAAVIRELAEETGLAITAREIDGPLARRVVRHGYSDQITVQDETFYAVRVPTSFDVSTAGHTADEQLTITGHRWWPIADLAATDETIWPSDLCDLLRLDAKAGFPVVLPDVEESSVPIGDNRSAD